MGYFNFKLPDVFPSFTADKERPQGKSEQDSSVDVDAAQCSEKKQNVFQDLSDGRLGTIQIHKSGKVILRMGDYEFVVDSGTQVSYVQVSLHST